MSFDYKKEYKEFYLPPAKPTIVNVPEMKYLSVKGKGDPNIDGGEYKLSIGLLYCIAFTLKMSYKGSYKIEGYFDYVVPPLEGFWWQKDIDGFDYTRKSEFEWISLIRVPDFVKEKDFEWAIEEAERKKKEDFSKVKFLTYKEGLSVQIMHIGKFDDEPSSVKLMQNYAKENSYEEDFSFGRYHHEIYLSDARKVSPEKMRTVIRHPIKKV